MRNIRLVLSDVDGTLIDKDKQLAPATIAAVRRLDMMGIGFTVASSRPPAGFRMLVEPLNLRLPIGAFNGGTLVTPQLEVLEVHFVDAAAAETAVRVLAEFGAAIWVFADGAWLVTDPSGAYVLHERRIIGDPPIVVTEFGAALARAGKIVGSSTDFDRLAACEAALQTALGGSAQVSLSQPYYLDITPAGLNKGSMVETLSRRLGIATAEIATIGDMANDIPMFRRSGLGIAMGNGTAEVKAAATEITTSNDANGFARAMQRFIFDDDADG